MRDFSLIVHAKEVNLMASPSHPETPCTFWFEFDSVSKILLLRFEGQRLTPESLTEIHKEARKNWEATGARAGIGDYSSVTEFALSGEFVRSLAQEKPPMPDATKVPLFIVMPSAIGYGLARMYQMVGERTQPLVTVVHTMDEALASLGVQSPKFTPLEMTVQRQASTYPQD